MRRHERQVSHPVHARAVARERPGARPVDERRLGAVGHRVTNGETEPELPVLRAADRLVEAAEPADDVTTRDDGVGRDEVPAQEPGEDPSLDPVVDRRVARGEALPHEGRVLEPAVGVGPDRVGAGEEPGAAREGAREQKVVGVEEHHGVRREPGQADVAGRGRAPVRLGHARDPPREGPQRVGGPVGRAVVHDDDVRGRRLLGEGALDRRRHRGRRIVRRDHDADAQQGRASRARAFSTTITVRYAGRRSSSLSSGRSGRAITRSAFVSARCERQSQAVGARRSARSAE